MSRIPADNLNPPGAQLKSVFYQKRIIEDPVERYACAQLELTRAMHTFIAMLGGKDNQNDKDNPSEIITNETIRVFFQDREIDCRCISPGVYVLCNTYKCRYNHLLNYACDGTMYINGVFVWGPQPHLKNRVDDSDTYIDYTAEVVPRDGSDITCRRQLYASFMASGERIATLCVNGVLRAYNRRFDTDVINHQYTTDDFFAAITPEGRAALAQHDDVVAHWRFDAPRARLMYVMRGTDILHTHPLLDALADYTIGWVPIEDVAELRETINSQPEEYGALPKGIMYFSLNPHRVYRVAEVFDRYHAVMKTRLLQCAVARHHMIEQNILSDREDELVPADAAHADEFGRYITECTIHLEDNLQRIIDKIETPKWYVWICKRVSESAPWLNIFLMDPKTKKSIRWQKTADDCDMYKLIHRWLTEDDFANLKKLQIGTFVEDERVVDWFYNQRVGDLPVRDIIPEKYTPLHRLLIVGKEMLRWNVVGEYINMLMTIANYELVICNTGEETDNALCIAAALSQRELLHCVAIDNIRSRVYDFTCEMVLLGVREFDMCEDCNYKHRYPHTHNKIEPVIHPIGSTNYIVLFCGPQGSRITSVCRELHRRVPNSSIVSHDLTRRTVALSRPYTQKTVKIKVSEVLQTLVGSILDSYSGGGVVFTDANNLVTTIPLRIRRLTNIGRIIMIDWMSLGAAQTTPRETTPRETTQRQNSFDVMFAALNAATRTKYVIGHSTMMYRGSYFSRVLSSAKMVGSGATQCVETAYTPNKITSWVHHLDTPPRDNDHPAMKILDTWLHANVYNKIPTRVIASVSIADMVAAYNELKATQQQRTVASIADDIDALLSHRVYFVTPGNVKRRLIINAAVHANITLGTIDIFDVIPAGIHQLEIHNILKSFMPGFNYIIVFEVAGYKFHVNEHSVILADLKFESEIPRLNTPITIDCYCVFAESSNIEPTSLKKIKNME